MAPVPVGLVEPPAKEQAVHPSRTKARRRDPSHTARAIVPWSVAVVALLLRLATAATGPTDWDSAQYAAAVGRFDVTHGRPQPPGYWLYVASGRLLHAALGIGVVQSLVLVAALASAGAAGLTALAGADLGGWWVGLSAGAIVAFSPFAWFSGSIVATYSFDMLACAALVVLAWRARPASGHGIGAALVLGLAAGFRQSVVQSFALLALVAVVAATRNWRRLLATVLAGIVAVGVWLVPMALAQPGGLVAWARATRQEAAGAAHLTSVLDHAPGGATNIGTFAAYTVLALAPLAVLTSIAALVLLSRRISGRLRRISGRHADHTADDHSAHDHSALDHTARDHTARDHTARRADGDWTRPWYQGRIAVLAAAIVPPVLLVSLVQFAKGGYLLAYLPAACIALLLPVGALIRRRDDPARLSRGWTALATFGVVVIVALGAQRFLAGDGVLPNRWVESTGAIWLEQPRYQAPYLDTRAAIREADQVDTALAGLGTILRPGRDVVVFDTLDGGPNIYRNAGYVLPRERIALVGPGAVVYNQLHGSLYYGSGHTLAVGPGGSVLLVASPALPGLARLTADGYAVPVRTKEPIGGYLVWRVPPGSSVLGLRIVEAAGPRPLGTGI